MFERIDVQILRVRAEADRRGGWRRYTRHAAGAYPDV